MPDWKTHPNLCQSNQSFYRLNTIYFGKDTFNLISKRLGILNGSKFKYLDVIFVLNTHLEPSSILTLDPKLFKLLEDMESKL